MTTRNRRANHNMEEDFIPLEAPIIPREDNFSNIPTEQMPAREVVVDDAPPAITKTQSEITIGDSLISSFANSAISREIEVVFAFDTTKSMKIYLDEVRKKLKETCTKLTTDIPQIKIGIMAIGDYYDPNYACKFQDLCTNIDTLVKWVDGVEGTVGGDRPEAYELALREANTISWNSSAHVNKALVVIGDSVPHAPSFTDQHIYWRDQVMELKKKGVKIYGVQCNNHAVARPFYEELAEMTGGVYVTLKHLPLVTDMFKAVCYREFGDQHLETYRAEVTNGGRMDDTMADMFDQLKGTDGKPAAELGKRLKDGWYLSEFDNVGVPHFLWLNSEKRWKRRGHHSSNKNNNTNTSSPTTATKRKNEEQKEASPAKKTKKEEEKAEKKKAKKETKKAKKETKKAKKETVGEKAAKNTKKPKAKKVKQEEEEEEKPKKLVKGQSIIIGTGEWKRDRFGRMASLHDS